MTVFSFGLLKEGHRGASRTLIRMVLRWQSPAGIRLPDRNPEDQRSGELRRYGWVPAYRLHYREEEWIYVLAGRGIAEIGDEEITVGAGDFLILARTALGVGRRAAIGLALKKSRTVTRRVGPSAIGTPLW